MTKIRVAIATGILAGILTVIGFSSDWVNPFQVPQAHALTPAVKPISIAPVSIELSGSNNWKSNNPLAYAEGWGGISGFVTPDNQVIFTHMSGTMSGMPSFISIRLDVPRSGYYSIDVLANGNCSAKLWHRTWLADHSIRDKQIAYWNRPDSSTDPPPDLNAYHHYVTVQYLGAGTQTFIWRPGYDGYPSLPNFPIVSAVSGIYIDSWP